MPSWARARAALGTFLATPRPANRGGRRRGGHRPLHGTVRGALDEDKEEGAVSDVVPAPAAQRACRDAGFILRRAYRLRVTLGTLSAISPCEIGPMDVIMLGDLGRPTR